MLAVLGGFTGIDAVSCVQAMVGRPIVAGPLAGLVLGDPIAGMWVGVLLEILSLHQLPVGASRGWDTGPAAVAGAVVATTTPAGPAALLLATGYGVLVGWVGSWTVHLLRRFNARLVADVGDGIPSSAGLAWRHLTAVALDLLRAAALTLSAIWLYTRLPIDLEGVPVVAAASLLLVTASLAAGVAVRMMARGRRVWTAFGFAAGLSGIIVLWLG
ncbi:MAG: PTS sugar transporter subunit IIC [Gemmatimonadota bacterium]|nr:MAG: PTS sugar transporter subunit IIC [Gemmatimonadota bacterium]